MDNENTTDTKTIDNIENIDDYILSGRSEIMQKLRSLGKKRSLMTIHFENQSMLSTVVDVLADKDLLVLDYGSNEKLNQKLIQSSKAIVKTDYNGITAQFTITNIQKARLKGQSSFACSLPETVLWVQRREFYRVRVPLSENVTCEIVHSNNIHVEYRVLDISTGGIALFDPDGELELEPGHLFEGCKLTLGKHKTTYINLEIQNNMLVDSEDPSKGTRCGCAFIDISSDFEVSLQKFINMV